MADNQDAIELQRRARRRLVGAIALVVFVVIVLPIIFDREPKPISQDLTIQIPSQDAGRFASRVLPSTDSKSDPKPPSDAEMKGDAAGAAPDAAKAGVDATSARPAVPAGGSDKSGASSSAKADKAGETAKSAAAPRPAVGAAPASRGTAEAAPKLDTARAVAKAPAATSSDPSRIADAKTPAANAKPDAALGTSAESFVIPLGLFRNPDNVKKVRGWVGNAGYKSFTEPAPDANGVKVLAGPFPTRDAAEKARDKLKAKGVDVGAIAAR